VPQHLRFVPRLSEWRRDNLRTTLWLVPALEMLGAGALFALTYFFDRAAYDGHITLPAWVDSGSADAARQILTAIAAAVITVVGLVFSITIVALTLASTQFGPRMLRNFIRDRITQLTLGSFVASFVYAMLALGSVSHESPAFVPHLSITVAIGLVLVDVAVLVVFIHHVAKSIQLPEVIAGIARDLSAAIDAELPAIRPEGVPSPAMGLDPSAPTVPATSSGYLQYVRIDELVGLAVELDATIELLYRPGHFVVEGLPLARVVPQSAAPALARVLQRNHVTGANRTLTQDLSFAIDQLVEIAIRALSPAVNDTFTALTCIDWLSDGLSKLTLRWGPQPEHRDAHGRVRVITAAPNYEGVIQRAFDKIRQAGRGMPAVLIRQLDALTRIAANTNNDAQRRALLHEAEMVLRASEESIPEPSDRADVRRRYDALVDAATAPDRTDRDPSALAR